jgi:hypothetical protein
MNWVAAILALIRLIGFITTKISMKDGEKAQIAKELAELNSRLSITRDIVKENVTDEQVDTDLRS